MGRISARQSIQFELRGDRSRMTNIDIIIFVGSCIDIFRLWVPSYTNRLDPVAQFKDPCTIWVTVNVAG